MIARWSTLEPLPADFARRWRPEIEASPYANYSLSLDVLAWEAEQGRHALAVLAEDEDAGQRGGLVLRESEGGLQCGWPWRWQAVVAERPAAGPLGFDAADAAWLFRVACEAADGRRVRCYLPHPPPSGVSGYAAGATIIQSLGHSNEEMLRSLGSSKRRLVRRAIAAGYQVEEAAGADAFLEFHRVQSESKARWQSRSAGDVSPHAEPWREWELPWMWLLVARKAGRVHSGVGDGVIPGGFVEGRTAASTLEGRQEGASALLGLEEAKRARDRGHRWLNHCGDTTWKREISGRLGSRHPMWCWLSGGRWALPNTAETTWMSFRPAAARWLRRWRRKES